MWLLGLIDIEHIMWASGVLHSLSLVSSSFCPLHVVHLGLAVRTHPNGVYLIGLVWRTARHRQPVECYDVFRFELLISHVPSTLLSSACRQGCPG